MLTVFNSLSKQKEVFIPLKPNQVSMYVCGVTVYDHCHLGHARFMIIFDMIANYLRHLGYSVKYVQNITDVDDKIIKKALELDQDFTAISQEFTLSMQQDIKSLDLGMPDVLPKASEHIQDMISMIEILMDKGFAYAASNGDICFAVEKFEGYGKLSRQDLNQLLAGVRIESSQDKRFAADFVLWKPAKPGEPAWPSPFGPGRPGWHIECSAMAKHHLGAHIDIHGGGLDLQFPHHENEIAQSEACHGETFANYWLHVGMLQLNHEKMSKSTGNFLTIKDALKSYHPEVIKLFYLSSHYRSPLNFNDEGLKQTYKSLQRLYQTLKNFEHIIVTGDSGNDTYWTGRFQEAMNDDFNTTQALAVLFELNTQINKTPSPILLNTLVNLGKILGVLKCDPHHFLQFSVETSGMSDIEIEDYIEKRKQARMNKQYAKADEIRQFLQKQGIELEDSAAGTSWRRLI
jgi:cysteinyl-tRNA synthetase